jgi:hypothetical protein
MPRLRSDLPAHTRRRLLGHLRKSKFRPVTVPVQVIRNPRKPMRPKKPNPAPAQAAAR